MKKIIISMLVLSLVAISCKKKDGDDEVKVGGCTDTDSPFYQSGLDYDDGACKYAYVTQVEVLGFPEKDGGSSWDFGGRADIFFKMKPSNAVSYADYFTSEGNEHNNADYNVTYTWTSPNQFKLTNETWFWTLVDDDDTSADDEMASGTLNPIGAINTADGTLTLTSTSSNGDTRIRVTLLIQ
jgi:hypothetical protein